MFFSPLIGRLHNGEGDYKMSRIKAAWKGGQLNSHLVNTILKFYHILNELNIFWMTLIPKAAHVGKIEWKCAAPPGSIRLEMLSDDMGNSRPIH